MRSLHLASGPNDRPQPIPPAAATAVVVCFPAPTYTSHARRPGIYDRQPWLTGDGERWESRHTGLKPRFASTHACSMQHARGCTMKKPGHAHPAHLLTRPYDCIVMPGPSTHTMSTRHCPSGTPQGRMPPSCLGGSFSAARTRKTGRNPGFLAPCSGLHAANAGFVLTRPGTVRHAGHTASANGSDRVGHGSAEKRRHGIKRDAVHVVPVPHP